MLAFELILVCPALAREQDVTHSETSSQHWVCRAAGVKKELPQVARESSGLARSLLRPGILWTHNDRGNRPYLFAVDESGRLVQSVHADLPAVDWEDLEIGPCVDGSCLYLGDIGDNDGERGFITIYRISEPGMNMREAGPVVALRVRFPDGPKDTESLFALSTGDLFLVTKGRRHDIGLYRYPAPQRPGEIVLLERVRDLFPEPQDSDDRVTAATATPNSQWIGIRTYRTLYVYDADRLIGGETLDPSVIDLSNLAEPQGEGLAMADDGTVWLSSEAANRKSVPELHQLKCTLPQVQPGGA